MQTKPLVTEFIQEIRRLDWFAAVGANLMVPDMVDVPVLRVSSWPEAARVIRSADTRDFLTESRNGLHREQSAATSGSPIGHTDVFNKWIRELRPVISEIADRAVASPNIPSEIGRDYASRLKWMLAHECMIRQYRPYIKKALLYTGIAQMLLAGHCVCGWRGCYPDGWLVVY